VELRPLTERDYPLLRELEEQEDVWESVGALPTPEEGGAQRLFVITEGAAALGVGGLVPSRALGEEDVEVFCALRSEAQLQGNATRACELIIAWAFSVAKLDRVVASIDDANETARTVAVKLGMKPLRPLASGRTVYVRTRNEPAPDGVTR